MLAALFVKSSSSSSQRARAIQVNRMYCANIVSANDTPRARFDSFAGPNLDLQTRKQQGCMGRSNGLEPLRSTAVFEEFGGNDERQAPLEASAAGRADRQNFQRYRRG